MYCSMPCAGQLEFINGGWCMNDEATPTYIDIIDQMTLGLRFLNDTFGIGARPLVAWHIDPFGHSREQASLFAQMGFDGFFFGRLDYQDKEKRQKEKNMEGVWRGSANLNPPSADLFTGVLPNGYNPPDGFCWDQLCADEPIVDDKNSREYNKEKFVSLFLETAKKQSKYYKTNHIIMTMGSDFQYENANVWFKNMDKLIKHVNEKQKDGSKVNVFYSTPSCYLQDLNKAKLTWSVKYDDFFPYADSAHSFWTGYFTSRPALKRYVRRSSALLQVCNQLEVLAGTQANKGPYGRAESTVLRQAMAVAQHHDAVTGTEKQHVANDYAWQLSRGWLACETVIKNALYNLSGNTDKLSICPLLNISLCSVTESEKQFRVMLYNPLGREIAWNVRVPVQGRAYTVANHAGKPLDSQVMPQFFLGLYHHGKSHKPSVNELVFQASAPPLGFSTYTVTSQKGNVARPSPPQRVQHQEVIVIQNEHLQLTFNGTTGLLSSMKNLDSGLFLPVVQNFYWYQGSKGNAENIQTSGAYIFRPNVSTPLPISPKAQLDVVKGRLVEEVRQTFSPWCQQVVRLYQGSRHAEFEWHVGSIPIVDHLGREIITRFDTPLRTKGLFLTDANGREMLTRRRNFRPTWKLNNSEPVAGNYYPITSTLAMKDEKAQVTLVTDRSQGGSSMKDGSLELMIHRRLLFDDFRGVGEALNETGANGQGLTIRGRHLLFLAPPDSSARLSRLAGELQLSEPQLVFGTLHKKSRHPYKDGEFSGLRVALPASVHVLSLSRWDAHTLLLRLELQFEKHDDRNLSRTVTINIARMFSTLDVESFKEMTLGANLRLKDLHRLSWDTVERENEHRSKAMQEPTDPSDMMVTLQPMQIRTFLVRTKAL
uniref:Alpha-mannosidase n=2 Tax=Eptatretus burgeri TaxID=7764 RepID=A0A8C4Q1D9_EPTBU